MARISTSLICRVPQRVGTPLELRESRTWVLKRQIPGCAEYDAMGCYPLFTCGQWSRLHLDLQTIGSSLVSLSLVTSPFADVVLSDLESCFDLVKPFKNHFIFDTSEPLETAVSKHHRYYARRALKEVAVEAAEHPPDHLDAWLSLYRNLIARQHISGIRAFSKRSFERQLQLPDLVMIVARLLSTQDIVGAHLVVRQGNVAYSHLAAFSDEGYRVGAAYGVYWETLKYVAGQGVRYLDIGAAAGLDDKGDDGLSRFKKGWSNANRLNYLCGRIFDEDKYNALCHDRGNGEADYFPLYRQGEFA
jgi:hypothetical protein